MYLDLTNLRNKELFDNMIAFSEMTPQQKIEEGIRELKQNGVPNKTIQSISESLLEEKPVYSYEEIIEEVSKEGKLLIDFIRAMEGGRPKEEVDYIIINSLLEGGIITTKDKLKREPQQDNSTQEDCCVGKMPPQQREEISQVLSTLEKIFGGL